MRKNEPTATLRRQDIIIKKDGGDPADRSAASALLAMLFVGGASSPHVAAGLGTLTNKRCPLTFSAFTFTVNHVTSTSNLSATAHGLQNGDGPIQLTTTGSLPTGLAAATNYYVIFVDADTFKLAASLTDAYAATAVTFSTDGSGTNQVIDVSPGSQRGLDGYFTYEHTQAETNVAVDTLEVIVEGTGYAAANGGGGYTSALLDQNATLLSTVITRDGKTVEEVLRFVYCADGAGKLLRSGTDYTLRDELDTSDRAHGTLTSAGGRTVAIVDDTSL